MERSKSKRYVIGAATFATALSIGFVLQYGDALASRVGVEAPVSGPDTLAQRDDALMMPVTASIATPQNLNIPVAPARDTEMVALSSVPADITVPSIAVPSTDEPAPVANVEMPDLDETVIELAVADLSKDLTLPDTSLDATVEPVTQEPIASCDVRVLAVATDMAMVDVTLDAPCHMEKTVSVYHQGMTFATQTDDLGLAQLTIPALNEHALFIFSFEDGTSAMAQAFVPDMNDFDRAVLQWTGATGFELHALHGDTSYGQDGHVWNGIEGSLDVGVVTSFTGGKHQAEIYTYPAGQTSITSDVQLNIEAKIHEQNCGQAIAAQAIQIGPNRTTGITELAMTLPGCDAVGEYLVLKNIYEDLTLAAK